MTIGDNIKRYRKQNKISQAKLSELIGKSKSSIEKYEANKVSPTIQVLNDIANALSISVSDLTNNDMKILVNNHIESLTDEEIITEINRRKYEYELNNGVSLRNKLDTEQMELLYISEIKSLKDLIESQNLLSNTQSDMINTQKSIIESQAIVIRDYQDSRKKTLNSISSFGGDTNGK